MINPPKILLAALICATVLLNACDSQPPLHQRQFLGFGTIIHIDISGVDEATAAQAFDLLETDFAYMTRTWSPWQQGATRRTNDLISTTQWFSVAPSVLPLINKSMHIMEQSGGLFDPTMANLIELWGFHQELDLDRKPPLHDDIQAWLRTRPSADNVQHNGILLRSTNPNLAFAFGAIAKGYGLDKSIQQLRTLGINNAIVNAGGDLRAIGDRGNRPWRIGIRHPRAPGVLASIEINGDESIFTSGDYERAFEYQGKHYHHILDPRTGYPAEGVTSVTVIHNEGAVADAAATALFVAGPQHWHALAKALNIRFVMLIESDGTVHMNPAMAERIQFEVSPSPPIRLSEPL